MKQIKEHIKLKKTYIELTGVTFPNSLTFITKLIKEHEPPQTISS